MKLSWKPYTLDLRYTFTIATYSRTSTPIVLVKLEHEDFVGYGEASLPQYLGATQETVISFLQKLNLNQFKDPTQIEDILTYVDGIDVENTAAKASIDIALHDLVGKMCGKSWHALWGLDKTKAPLSTYTIGMDTDNMVRKKTEEAVKDFKLLKIKLGGKNDKQMIETIRSVTNLPLAIDANQAWKDRNEAIEMIAWLNEKGAILVEQPMLKTDLENNAWVTERSVLPTFADESVQRLSDMNRLKGVFSGINIKLMKCTGMNEAWKMIKLAPSLGLDVMLGCMTETSCAISAAAQLSPAVNFADLDGAMLIKNDCFDGMKIIEGKITLNTNAGIGAKPTNLNPFN